MPTVLAILVLLVAVGMLLRVGWTRVSAASAVLERCSVDGGLLVPGSGLRSELHALGDALGEVRDRGVDGSTASSNGV